MSAAAAAAAAAAAGAGAAAAAAGPALAADGASTALSALLLGHEADARAVCAFALPRSAVAATGTSTTAGEGEGGGASGGVVRCAASASRDGTVRVWAEVEVGAEQPQPPRFVCAAVLRGHAGFVGAVAALPPRHAALADWAGNGISADDALPGGAPALAALRSAGALLTAGNDARVCVWAVPVDAIALALVAASAGSGSGSGDAAAAAAAAVASGSSGAGSGFAPDEGQVPVATLQGHADGVSAADAAPDGAILTAGLEKDKTARVWRGAACTAVLRGHEHGVWDVLAVPAAAQAQAQAGEYAVATASADRTVRLWSRPAGSAGAGTAAGDAQLTCTTVLRQHTDCVRGLARLPAVGGFASCANDGQVLLWTSAGECVGSVPGHDAFVYTLACLQDPVDQAWHILTASEDRTSRITPLGGPDSATKVLAHPNTTWSVAAWADTSVPGRDASLVPTRGGNDVITGCADGVVRVWSVDTALRADEDTLQVHNGALGAQQLSKKGGQVGDIDVDSLPGPEALDQPGASDGATQMVRSTQPGQTDPIVEVFQWSAAGNSWTKIGEVVDTASGDASKQLMGGKEYDHVFDVDLGDGAGMRKLGYNNGENPYVVAQNFIHAHELQQDFLDEIATFIEKNTQQFTIGGPPAEALANPHTAPARYVPGGDAAGAGAAATPAAAPGAPVHIPLRQPLLFDQSANFALVQQKITEFVAEETGKAQTPEHAAAVTALAGKLGAVTTPLTTADLDLVRALCEFGEGHRFPGLDLLRLCALHPLPSTDGALLSSLWEAAARFGLRNGRVANRMLALRYVCNALGAAPSAAAQRALILQGTGAAAGGDAASAAAGPPVDEVFDLCTAILDVDAPAGTANKNIRIAAATALLDIAVVASTGASPEPSDVVIRALSCSVEYVSGVARGLTAAGSAGAAAFLAEHGEATYRTLVALGTVSFLQPQVSQLARDLEVTGPLNTLSTSAAYGPSEAKIAAVAGEVARHIAA